jgi:hypothetical protein
MQILSIDRGLEALADESFMPFDKRRLIRWSIGVHRYLVEQGVRKCVKYLLVRHLHLRKCRLKAKLKRLWI